MIGLSPGRVAWLVLFLGCFAGITSVGAQELIQDATGRQLTAAPWLRYAEAKYLEEQEFEAGIEAVAS